MKIAVLSDIHDNLANLASALRHCESADLIVFCGDFCAPFALKALAEGFSGPIHAVFGNNDGDRFSMQRIAGAHKHVTLHGEYLQLNLDGFRIAANHYPEIAADVAASGIYDAVFYGHNHTLKLAKIGETDLINPGEIMGMTGRATMVLYDSIGRAGSVIDL